MTRHSPCVGVCTLDDTAALCLGCGRTRNEIAQWITMSEAERDGVWLRLPGRLKTLSVRVRLMPWTRDELRDWTAATIADRKGTWVTGAPGALAEFPCTTEREVSVDATDEAVTARAPDASFRLRVSDKLRAFTFADGPIVLGLPKARASMPSPGVIEVLGADRDAIDIAHQGDALFDFGVGRKSSRFCIRTNDESLAGALASYSGHHWSDVMPAIGSQLLSAGPNRIVETAAARIEVFAPIPTPGTQSPAGAHTHFLPAFLQSEEEIPASLTLPEFAWPVAIFYPQS